MMNISSKKAFTLMEALIGGIIIAMVSLMSWTAISALTHSGEMSRNQSVAVNLLQKTQEEIRRVAQTQFDGLESCVIPSTTTATGTGTCGFQDLTVEFKGFTRSVIITPELVSSEIKRSLVTVTWTEYGQDRSLQSIVLISRPADALPGNIIGTVRSSDEPSGHPLIEGATILATRVSTGATEAHNAGSTGVLDAKNANFDFSEGGQFVLTPGTWHLTATHPGYVDYDEAGENIQVEPNTEVPPVAIEMIPKPEDATIEGFVTDMTGATLPSFRGTASGTSIFLFENGLPSTNTSPANFSNANTYKFTVKFNNNAQRCFTLNTAKAYRARYAYPVNSGGSPSCLYGYNPQGWSSAVVDDGRALYCSNPYNGAAGSGGFPTDPDRICVDPGDNRTNVNIPLAPVPTVTLKGRVVDDSPAQVGLQGKVDIRWPQGTAGGDLWETINTNPDGTFTVQVPAVQELFANSTNKATHYLQVRANASVQIPDCCGDLTPRTSFSNISLIGPIFKTSVLSEVILSIPLTSYNDCGNAEGDITNGAVSGSLISGANVSILLTTSAVAGHYKFSCDKPGIPATPGTFKIPVGSYEFIAAHPNYYTYRSATSNFYYTAPGRQTISTGGNLIYNASLWPKGFGNLEVTVIDQKTGLALKNMTVTLTDYLNSNFTLTTDDSGKVTFNGSGSGVIETWPPPDLPASSTYYKYDVKQHVIKVDDPSTKYLPASATPVTVVKGVLNKVTIELERKGAL